MSPKKFLLEECENVKDLLDKTLRHDYGMDSSRHFYDECATRLSFVTSQIETTNEADTSVLATWGSFLSTLAELICRIERSSLGEYSWPFVEELKKIATAICRESTLTNPDSPPNIYVFAEGGLVSYAIYTERQRPSASQKRLLTIVFPKSLKHFVLLHPILGHELGHAIWQVSKHRHVLRNDVISHLCRAGGHLEDSSATAAWLYSSSAPPEVKDYLSKLTIKQDDAFQTLNWEAWIEEILCDLIGLMTFGPGFAAAHFRLLNTVDPSGFALDIEHPPVGWRINMILACAKLLEYDKLLLESSPLQSSMKRFWESMEAFKKADSWYDFLSDSQLKDAMFGIKQLLDLHPPSSYPEPTSGQITMLVEKLANLIPPVGHNIAADFLPKLESIDFRHIIYAGWIATSHERDIPFKRINQLCEHAIMQQGAIEMVLSEKLA